MKLSVSRDVKILSLAFLFIFLGYAGVQQYVTTFFSDAGLVGLGFQSLILVYLFFAIFNPLSAVFVSRYGAKRCMMASSIFYSLFILLLMSKSAILIYISSCLLGIAASLLWTGQNSYLIRASDRKSYGANSGFFSSLLSLGSASGVLILGVAVSISMLNSLFLAFSIFPLIGFLILSKLEDRKTEGNGNRFRLVKKSIASKTALRLSSVFFATSFVFGLAIGIIPLEINKSLGAPYIGILSSLFFILPFLISFFFGKLSDIKGRRMMIVFSYILLITGIFSLYLSWNSYLLVLGIVLLALNRSVMYPILSALIGDVSTENNLEFLTALFWTAQNIAITSALILSQIFIYTSDIYLASILVIITSFIILLPLLMQGTEKIRERISQEME